MLKLKNRRTIFINSEGLVRVREERGMGREGKKDLRKLRKRKFFLIPSSHFHQLLHRLNL